MENIRSMWVIKRNNTLEELSFDKILNRIRILGKEANININYQSLVMKVIDQLYDKISTTKIDELAAEQCAMMSTIHPDYSNLAGRIIISNHQKNTCNSFFDVINKLYNFEDIHKNKKPMVTRLLWKYVNKYKTQIDEMIDYSRDYLIDYFGFKTLERSYLLHVNNKIIERPQHMWMRVSIGIHVSNIKDIDNIDENHYLNLIEETYNLMSLKYFTHATPTLFNAGTNNPQLSSCFLLGMESDSLDGIYNTLHDCAMISKYAGGIGIHIHDIRAKGSHIQGTNGTSNGIIPMLRVFNNTARYVDQCVVPETYIYTTNGPIRIQNCVIDETEIFNNNGEIEVIENVLEHPYNGELIEIETSYSFDTLKITPEHPVYVLKNDKDYKFDNIKNKLDVKEIKFEWINSSNLNKNDMIIYKIPTFYKDIKTITEDDCYMFGILLGSGIVSNTSTNIYITLNTEYRKGLLPFILNYLENKCIKYSIKTNESNTKIKWTKNINVPFRYSDIYNENEKRIHPKWINLSSDKITHILKGLLQTSGCISNNIILEASSSQLKEDIRFMLLKVGVLAGGYKKSNNNNSNNSKNETYVLRIPKTEYICKLMNIKYEPDNMIKIFRYNDYLLAKIKNIKTIKYNGTLYDLQMKNIHNYMIHNGVIHNGGGKRNGSFAIYIEMWHPDIEDFLELKKNHGDEELKARDLFYALWICDLFMERVKNNEKWSLFCPNECPGLSDVYGEKFIELYEKYENEEKARKIINARDLWFKILDAQMETGTPYIVYKDAANKKSNQQNLGTIKSSNLCTEIIEYSDENESAVCNLASIGLPTFVDKKKKQFNYEELHRITKVVTNNLNKVIDVNFYPTEKTQKSNMKHRPIGIGVQGLADVFILMDIPFHSEEAKIVNKYIFETIYHAALEKSNEIAKSQKYMIINSINKDIEANINKWDIDNILKRNNYDVSNFVNDPYLGAYCSFIGSPASNGILQFDMWGIEPTKGRYDWDTLKKSIKEHGLRNSLLVAPMPTASTSQILGFNECFEPITSNIYSRRTIAGDFIVINKYLQQELIELGYWNEDIKNNIIANKGSIQQLTMLPEKIRNKYKIVWEMPMKHLIDMSADRGAFICQSQSLNLWMEDPTYAALTSMHFYSWSKGLKTGIYYLRRKAKHQAQQFTIEPEENNTNECIEEICEMCSA